MDELDVINFTNIDSEDYEGMWGGKTTIIKAGETRAFPRFLAEHYAKHLTDHLLINEGKDFGDKGLRQPFLDRILGQVAVPISYTATPENYTVSNTPVAEPIKAPELPVEFAEAPYEKVVVETPKKRGRTKKIK